MNKMFRRFLAAGAAVVMLTAAAMPSYAAAEKFTDVKPGTWYYTAVDYAVSEGLFGGTSATTFEPNSPMTRGMFVTVLGNKAGIDKPQYAESSFSDVKPGAWYAPGVEWAAQNGIVNGTGSGRFSPDRSVTREQMAVILYNYAEFTDCDLTVRAGMLDQFPDGNKTSGYARYAMEWAITHKLLSGSGGRLSPQGTATRAQVAQIFYNARELLAGGGSEPVDPTPSPSPAPDEPRIPITDEVRAKLKPNQDPEKLLDYVLNGKWDDPYFAYDGTSAKWDPSLLNSNDVARDYFGSWDDIEDEIRGSSMVANGFIQTLTYTDSDRFYITAEESDGCFCLIYRPANKQDSQKMREVKAALNLPSTKRYENHLRYEGTGWAGPMEWGAYNGAAGIARKIEFYLKDMHPDAKRYCITEPAPGVFYLLYSYGE